MIQIQLLQLHHVCHGIPFECFDDSCMGMYQYVYIVSVRTGYVLQVIHHLPRLVHAWHHDANNTVVIIQHYQSSWYNHEIHNDKDLSKDAATQYN